MAQRIQVLCDLHLEKDEEVAAAPMAFGMAQAGAKLSTYEVDLCEVCSKELLDILSQFAELGRLASGPKVRKSAARTAAPKSPAVAAPEHTDEEAAKQRSLATGSCPLCDYVAKQTKSASTSLRRHLKEVHGTTLEAAVGLPTPYICTDCGDAFSRPQGLALHRKRIHTGASVA